MQKRISALLLAMVIVIVSVLGGNTLKVKAASVAVSEEFAVELTMMLYNLLETVAISSGIKDGLDDYESGSSLYDAFIASVESMAEPPFYDTIITQPDGSQMTVKEALDAAESTLGSNALKLPTSETFAKYRVISGTGGNEPDPTPTPSSDPDNTPVPDTGYKDPFTYIQDVLVAGTLVSAMAGFFADLINGKIDGIDPDNYIPDGMFTGYPTESNAGKINIYASYFYNNSSTLSEEKYSYNATNEDCFYFLASYGTTASGSYILKPGIYYISSGRTVFPSYSFYKTILVMLSLLTGFLILFRIQVTVLEIILLFPIFLFLLISVSMHIVKGILLCFCMLPIFMTSRILQHRRQSGCSLSPAMSLLRGGSLESTLHCLRLLQLYRNRVLIRQKIQKLIRML